MKKIKHTLLAALVLSGAVTAQAAVQTVTVNSLVLANAKTGSGVLDLTQFNTVLGTLQSVEIDLFSDLSPTIRVENKSPANSTITATASEKLTMSTPATGTLVSLNGAVSKSFSFPGYDGGSLYGGTSGATYAPGATTFSNSQTYSDAGTLALFSGAGVVQTKLVGTAASLVNGTSGNTQSVVTSAFNGYARVVYTYATPVPEPETYAMLLAGLGMMGLVLRKRKAV